MIASHAPLRVGGGQRVLHLPYGMTLLPCQQFWCLYLMRLRSSAFALSLAVNGVEAMTTFASTEASVALTLARSSPTNRSCAMFISLPIIATTVSLPMEGSGLSGSSFLSVAID